MAISPLVPGAYKSLDSSRSLLSMRAQLDDLQRQLTTGKKSETFGGLGADRITSLSMRTKSSEIGSWRQTIVTLQIRAKQLDLGLNQIGKIGDDLRSSTFMPQFDPDASGKTSMQKYARGRFDEAIDILNTEINGERLYGGRRTDVAPALDPQTILVGDAAGRAGVQQMIAERKAADLGAGTGRLTLAGAGAVATVTEDGVHPFGFKVTAASSTSPGITAAYAAGPPAGATFTVTAPPVDGQEVRFELQLPDGNRKTVSLVARTGPLTPPFNAGEFQIGGTNAATGQNIRDAVAAAVASNSATALPGASAKAAADAFFAGSLSSPPLRVVGPPATATALAAGTPANTVIWYQGDDASANPRATVAAKIDTSQTVALGVQANEEGIRRVLSNLAVYINETFTNSPADQGRYQEMSNGIRADMSKTTGVQRVQTIQMEIGLAANTMKGADERHKTQQAFVDDILSGVEDASKEETAAMLLALQTQLQASYQTTSILSRLTLTDYLR